MIADSRSSSFNPFHLALAFVLVTSSAFAQDASPNSKIELTEIEFIGLVRTTSAEAIVASGLSVGQVVDIAAIDAAAQKLIDSGLFRKLAYRLSGKDGKAALVFEVEEETRPAQPVVFDNFVWFTDDELAKAIRAEIPTFEGFAADAAIKSITRALQKLIDTQKIQGKIGYAIFQDTSTGRSEHLFRVDGIDMPICRMEFPGTSAISESKLVELSEPLLSDQYGRGFVLSFAENNLVPLFREKGFLQAAFLAPVAKLAGNGADCERGVAVRVPVSEGQVYAWRNSIWQGNSVLTAEQLDKALGMKPAERANGLKIDKGLETVRILYGEKGHIAVRLTPYPEFDDAARRVTYRIDVNEGPQFRMGSVSFTGVSEAVADRLRSAWKLNEGDVYNDSYLKTFIVEEIPDVMKQAKIQFKSVSTTMKPVSETQTVDVEIVLK